MPFWKCHYHVIWATKNREPRITPEMESYLFGTIRSIAEELNSTIFAINGTEDHIHVAVAIPPSIAVAQWVKRCKGASSKAINHTFTNDDHFRWQNGYGVLSFGAKQLAYVVAYIEHQKQHHAEKTFQPYLEQID
jgi:putative transposase